MTPPSPNKAGPAEGVIRRKKKLVSSGGQTWFKRGSPKKSGSRGPVGLPLSSQPYKSRVSEEVTPPLLPPLLVQFSLEGHPDLRLSIFDKISLLSQKEKEIGEEVERGAPKKKVEEAGVEDGTRRLPEPHFDQIVEYELTEGPGLPNAYIRWMDRGGEELGEEVEYDVDEEDFAWLDLVNGMRGKESAPPVSLQAMELLMDRLEKESYLQMESTGMDQRPVIDDDAVCCICMDGECQNSNAILFCDMCNLAVHQECYGVPYIPEGQWLCRRCLQSPSRAVDCVLCPNKGGAFKQTDDGRWAHVVCAIWIPEVCFANTVFLEPVDSVTNIPPARWRLCCFICKYKGRGACIQCHKSNCYTAFHVTCAQHAGLCMKMETVRVGSTVTVRKTAYCDNHAPPDFIRSRDGESPTVRQKLKATRKMLAEKRSAIPMVSIPTIPPDRVSQISSSVTFNRKNQFIKRLMSYWKLKRIQRNGVPLLRRLQAASSASHHPTSSPTLRPKIQSPLQVESWRGEYKYLMRLRQDLERARLLCELIRKREKLKRESVVVREEEWDLTARPMSIFLLDILTQLGTKDVHGIFADPVDPEEVPDYRTIISCPMDLSTMRANVVAFEYYNITHMENDFKLMIDNCLLYNTKETMFYRAALKLQEVGNFIFREAHRVAEGKIGFDYESGGIHLPRPPSMPIPQLTDEQIQEEIDSFLSNPSRNSIPSEKHVALLEELMDKALHLRHPLIKKRRFNRLKQELSRLKRVTEHQESEDSNRSSPSFPAQVENESPIASPSPSPRRNLKSTESEDHEQRSRPPKRQVVKEMEKAAAEKQRGSPKRDTVSRPSRHLRNSSAESPEPPSQPSPMNRKMRDFRSVVNITGNSGEEGVGGRRRRGDRKSPPLNNSNGLSPQPRWSPLRNGPTQPNLRKRGSDGSPVITVRDSFTTYRTGGDTEINSEGDSANEDPDEDEQLTDEEDGESSETSSDDSSQSDSSSSSSLSNWRSRKKERSSDDQRSTDSDGEEPENSPVLNPEEEEEGRVVLKEEPQNLQDIPLEPLHLVWAQSPDGTWSPALIIDPGMSPEFTQNGVTIPCPPPEIVNKRPGRRFRRDAFLVLFFDNNRTWEWVSRNELEPLGLYATLDKRRLEEGRKPGEIKLARRAYEKAILHRRSVAGLHPTPLSPESE